MKRRRFISLVATALLLIVSTVSMFNLGAVADPTGDSNVLSPGVFDDLSTDKYFDFYIRGTWNDKGGGDPNNYNWNNDADYAKTFRKVTNTEWGRTKFLGIFMGETIPFAYMSEKGFNGSSILYQVEENSYVATAIIRKNDSPAEGMEHFDFKVSADRQTWTTVTPTITQSSVNDSDAFCCAYKALIQIPQGMSYYMITLPGFNRNATKGSEYTWALRDQEHWPTRSPEGYYIGCSLASAYDLTEYNLMYKVPDSPNYYKAELEDAIAEADAINLTLYIDDEAKTEFTQALEAAEAVMEDDDATFEEVDAAAERLIDAIDALNEKALPGGATIGQGDERLILKPGVSDWLEGSVFLNGQGDPLTASNGTSSWYCCYTDYATAGLIATQDNCYLTPENYIHATSYNFYLLNKLKTLSFMGKTIDSIFVNRASWAASNVMYKVYADSYLATAIVVQTNLQSAKDFPNVQDDYVFQVSADKTEWQTVDADMEKTATVDNFDVYKAVVKIPAGCYYCRIVMPGAQSISPDTKYHNNCPHYNHTFIGPSIASMYDLGDYDDYEDIPDAAEWYEDASLTSKDTSKIIISNGYFKCLVGNMSISDALATLNLETAGAEFYSKTGAKITDTSTKLAPGMKVDILDSKGLSLNKALGIQMLTVTSGTDLLSIGEVADIELKNSAPKTAAGLKLPETVKIEAANGEFDAEVNWDIAGCSYDPKITQSQEFTVDGTVVLPQGVTNGGGVDLTITVNITVLATEDYDVVSTDETRVKIDKESGMVFVKRGMTLKEISDLLDPVGDSFIRFADAEGNDIEDLNVEAKKGMTVDVYSSMVLIKSYEIDFLSGGGSNSPGTGNAIALLPAVLLVLISGAVMLFIRKRKGKLPA